MTGGMSNYKPSPALKALLDFLDNTEVGISSISFEDFNTPQEVINYNTELYDSMHGKNGWFYNLLTGKLERKLDKK